MKRRGPSVYIVTTRIYYLHIFFFYKIYNIEGIEYKRT